MERRVELLGQGHSSRGHPDGENQAHQRQPEPVGRRRIPGRKRGIQDPELFGRLSLLQALGHQGLLVTLQERVVELLGGLVVA